MQTKPNLLEGNIAKQLITLAIPLIIGNILQQFYNTFDAMVIGRYAGELEFAAVGVASSLMNFFIFALTGLCVGIMVIFAQFYGAKDDENFRKEHATALLAGLGLTGLLIIIGLLTLPYLLKLMQTPPEILNFTQNYLIIVILGLPFSYLYNLYASILRAVGRTRTPTLALFGAVVINLGLDLLLVGYYGQGVVGAALATVVSQLLAASICIWAFKKEFPQLFFNRRHCHYYPELFKKTLSYGLVVSLHQCSIYIGKLFIQGTINNEGIELIAAYTATTRIEGFVNSFGDSASAATSVLVAQNFGAKNYQRVQKALWSAVKILTVFGTLCSLLLYFTAPYTSALLLGKTSGIAYINAVAYLKVIAVCYLFCFFGNSLSGFFNGIGKVKIPFFGGATHLTIRIIITLFTLHEFQLPALAVATGIGWIYVNILWGGLYLFLRKSLFAK